MLDFLFTIKPFYRFGTEHLFWILFLFTYGTFWIQLGRRQNHEHTKNRIGLLLSVCSLSIWVLAGICNFFDSQLFSISTVLPLHLCYFLNIVFVFMHYHKSYKIYAAWFCWVMAACLQGLITADLDESFPHYINIRYFIVHGTLVIHILYAFLVYGFKVQWKFIVWSVLAGNIYYWLMKAINPLLHTNFMYTESRPPGTILDLLGEGYYWKANLLSVVLFTVVLLPFKIAQHFSSSRRA